MKTFNELVESTSGMKFHDTIEHAKKHGNRVVYGATTHKWHSVDKNDKDYHGALDPDEAKRHGMAHSLLLSLHSSTLKESEFTPIHGPSKRLDFNSHEQTGINRTVVQEAFESAKKKKNSNTPKGGTKTIEVKGPGPDEKFQKNPIVTPLTTIYSKS